MASINRRITTAPQTTFGRASAAGSTLQNVSRLAQARKASSHYFNVMGQHQGWMKYMAMIVASAILVASRVGIAWHSVVLNQDPETQAYAKKEAIRTTAREVGGLTFSYILFKVIENRLNRFTMGLGKLSGDKKYKNWDVVKPEDRLPSKGAATKQYFSNLKKAVSGQLDVSSLNPLKLYRSLSDINYADADMFHADGRSFGNRYNGSKMFRKLVNGSVRLGSWMRLLKEKGQRIKGSDLIKRVSDAPRDVDAMRKLYKGFAKSFPVTVAGGVALGLSGIFLEWFTLNHMDKVAGKLSAMRSPSLSPASEKVAMDTVGRAERVFQRFGGVSSFQ